MRENRSDREVWTIFFLEFKDKFIEILACRDYNVNICS